MKKTAAKDRKRLRPAAVLALSMALLLPGVGEASRTLPPAFGAKVVPEITAAELLNFSRSDAPAARRFTLIDAENCLSFAALSVVGSADTACFSAPSHFKLFDLPSPFERLSSLDLDQKTAYRRFFKPTERIYRQKLTLSGISHQGVYFLQPDPLGPVDSPNLYQGFGFDALNEVDPSGMGGPTISVGQLLDMARVEGVSEAGQRDLIAAHQVVGEFSLGLGQAAYGMVVSGGQQALRGSIRNSIDMALHVALRIQQAKRSGGTTGEGLAVTFTDFLQLTPLVEGMEGWEVYCGPLTLRQSLKRAGQGTFGLGITTLAVAGGVRTIGNAMSMDFLGEATMGGWLEFGEEMSQEASLVPGGGAKALPEFVLPRGFSSLGQFRGAMGELDDILLHHGIDDAVFRFRGSSTTGLSMNPNKPGQWFSLASDIDLSIESRKLSEMLYTAGQRPSRNVPGLFLPNKMGRALPPQLMDDLAAWNARWTRGLGIKNIEPAVSDPALVIHDITNVVYRPR